MFNQLCCFIAKGSDCVNVILKYKLHFTLWKTWLTIAYTAHFVRQPVYSQVQAMSGDVAIHGHLKNSSSTQTAGEKKWNTTICKLSRQLNPTPLRNLDVYQLLLFVCDNVIPSLEYHRCLLNIPLCSQGENCWADLP